MKKRRKKTNARDRAAISERERDRAGAKTDVRNSNFTK